MEFNKNLSKYLSGNCRKSIIGNPIFEGIRNNDITKALNNMSDFLRKRGIFTIPSIEVANIDSLGIFTIFAFSTNNMGCAFIWRRDDTTVLQAVAFTKDFDKLYAGLSDHQPVVWDEYVEMKGASVTRSLQFVVDVMKGKISMNSGALNTAIRDAQIWESIETDILVESDDPVMAKMQLKRQALYHKIRTWEKKGNDTTELQKQYAQLKDEIDNARVSVRGDVKMIPIIDPTDKRMEDRFAEEEKALPEERFSDMESYITNVVLGIDVCALISGAPGVGKTYRVMQIIKRAGLVRGEDYDVIKGKCTPLALYTMLHDYQDSRQILIIDDADDIIRDDVSINLIKAATDSSDERIVSYGSSKAPVAPEEKLDLYSDFEQDGSGVWRYPKNFVYNGGIIILTNMTAGHIDTAIRSRAMICDLNFTTAEILNIVRDLSPHIAPDVLTPDSKSKALKYLEDLANDGSPMDISLRSFVLVAKLYLSNAPEKDIQRRIREQMKLKFMRKSDSARKY